MGGGDWYGGEDPGRIQPFKGVFRNLARCWERNELEGRKCLEQSVALEEAKNIAKNLVF